MKATQLYQQLEKDFITPKLSDEWAEHMRAVIDFLCENFKQRSMGLVCDFATEINKVYTAVFPSKNVMQNILDRGETDLMLFAHHPSIWDIRKMPEVFQQMDRKLLGKFRKRRISIYNLHVPLDNYGEYSTGVSLTKVLDFKIKKPFAEYYGGRDGVICSTRLKNVQDVKQKLKAVLGHKVHLYKYGTNKIKDGKVAIITGGGNNVKDLKGVVLEEVNIFITGITVKNEHSRKAHEFAEKNKINILGGTHYSTEKFACIAMCKYFNKLGLPTEFIEDKPVMEDL